MAENEARSAIRLGRNSRVGGLERVAGRKNPHTWRLQPAALPDPRKWWSLKI